MSKATFKNIPYHELRIGDYMEIRDVVPVNGEKRSRWLLKRLNAYWMIALLNLGDGWSRPIRLTPTIIESFDVITNSAEHEYMFEGTPFKMVSLHDGTWSVELDNGTGISRVGYLHQLQNVYYDITGVELVNPRMNTIIREKWQ